MREACLASGFKGAGAALCLLSHLGAAPECRAADNLGDVDFPRPGVTTISRTVADADLRDDERNLIEANEQAPYRLKYAELAAGNYRLRAIRVESEYCRPPICSTYYIFADATGQHGFGAVNFATSPLIGIPEDQLRHREDTDFMQIEVETPEARLLITSSATALFVRRAE